MACHGNGRVVHVPAGWYIDPYSQERLDCSKAIFLLTTNAADRQILNFWSENSRSILEAQLQPSVLMRRLKPLDTLIRAAMAARCSVSLCQRWCQVIECFQTCCRLPDTVSIN
jgi:hypothetical protein